jgi:hypothetical protein
MTKKKQKRQKEEGERRKNVGFGGLVWEEVVEEGECSEGAVRMGGNAVMVAAAAAAPSQAKLK